MTDRVLNIDDYKPHLVIEGDSTHVVPVELVKKWISGDIEINKDCLSIIVKEWLAHTLQKKVKND